MGKAKLRPPLSRKGSRSYEKNLLFFAAGSGASTVAGTVRGAQLPACDAQKHKSNQADEQHVLPEHEQHESDQNDEAEPQSGDHS